MTPLVVPEGYDKPRAKVGIEKLMMLAQILSPLILGVLTAWVTLFGGLNTSKSTLELKREEATLALLKQREETQQKILDAAIAVLRKTPQTNADLALLEVEPRRWAIAVVNQYSASLTNAPKWLPADVSKEINRIIMYPAPSQ